MKSEMSMSEMIGVIRTAANNAPTPDECSILSKIASRIELLVVSESGLSLEMACIRHALDIPPGESVQSGVVKELVRLNSEILDLRNELAKLQKQEPVATLDIQSGRPDGKKFALVYSSAGHELPDDIYHLYAAPVPPVARQPEPISNDWVSEICAAVRYFGSLKHGEGRGEVDGGILAVRRAWDGVYALIQQRAEPATQPLAVPDEMPFDVRAVLAHRAGVIFSDDDAREIWNACRAAMLQSQPVSKPDPLPENKPCLDAPERIWLQTAGKWPAGGVVGDMTWCDDSQHPDDTLYIRADLATNHPVLPDGWVMVPKEPTSEMLEATWINHGIYHPSAYRTMLAAAPQHKDGDA